MPVFAATSNDAFFKSIHPPFKGVGVSLRHQPSASGTRPQHPCPGQQDAVVGFGTGRTEWFWDRRGRPPSTCAGHGRSFFVGGFRSALTFRVPRRPCSLWCSASSFHIDLRPRRRNAEMNRRAPSDTYLAMSPPILPQRRPHHPPQPDPARMPAAHRINLLHHLPGHAHTERALEAPSTFERSTTNGEETVGCH